MSITPLVLSTKDNASSTLNAGISAGATSIVLVASGGSLFPQAYNGTATSTGTSTTLNCTGILAAVGGSSSAMVGKFIYNNTDGSVGVVKSVSTNSLTTTALIGGTANTWANSNAWYIDPFVI